MALLRTIRKFLEVEERRRGEFLCACELGNEIFMRFFDLRIKVGERDDVMEIMEVGYC